MALHEALRQGYRELLITILVNSSITISSHGIPSSLLRVQAACLGIEQLALPKAGEGSEHPLYRAARTAVARGCACGIFGDIFVEAHRDWILEAAEACGFTPVFPLWRRPTGYLARAFIRAGFQALVVAARKDVLGMEILGRVLDEPLVEMLEEKGIDPCGENGEYHAFLWPILQVVATANMDAVPPEFLEEMRGISEGCRQEGYGVSFLDVLTLNLGFDVLESIFVSFAAIACNEFAVTGTATRDGRVFHGRDFMFPTGGGVFSDEALLIIHKPESGYPLIASAAPGFVGVPTALNSQGVSCGMDMVASILSRPIITGEGSLLLCRKAVQYGGSLEEAVSLIRDSDRAVLWLYLIADGEQGEAVVLETTASSLLPPQDQGKAFLSRIISGMLRLLFPCLQAGGTQCAAAPAGQPGSQIPAVQGLQGFQEGGNDVRDVRGVMVRGMSYTDPPWLAELIGWMEGNGNTCIRKLLPLQEESHPDLVAMTNHYLLPWKAVTYPSTGKKKDDTLWRYQTMLALLQKACGRIDRLRAMWIIDFLNPSRCDYYGTDTSQAVKGHHVLMDNRNKEMWSLHGHYDSAWAHADLDDFIK